jgi:hypothetical protein
MIAALLVGSVAVSPVVSIRGTFGAAQHGAALVLCDVSCLLDLSHSPPRRSFSGDEMKVTVQVNGDETRHVYLSRVTGVHYSGYYYIPRLEFSTIGQYPPAQTLRMNSLAISHLTRQKPAPIL